MLPSAVEAAVIVASKQGAIAQRGCKIWRYLALYGNDGLEINSGALSAAALCTPHNRCQGVAYTVEDVTLGIGGYCLRHRHPAPGLPRYIESQDSLHSAPSINLQTKLLQKPGNYNRTALAFEGTFRRASALHCCEDASSQMNRGFTFSSRDFF